MTKKSLPTTDVSETHLGRETLMEPTLAMRWGVPYVHLLAFAIDVDRIREHVEHDPEGVWPFGWEVFLTEIHLLGSMDIEDEDHIAMLEDVVLDLFERGRNEDPPLGSQVAFAVYDAITRGSLPPRLAGAFETWKHKPTELVGELAPLWETPELEAADLALACLEVELDPPVAPPTRDALEAMLETYERDAPYEGEPQE